MIAVDTSAIMAIALSEPQGPACERSLQSQTKLVISAATLAEALIVAGRRGIADAVSSLIDRLGFEIVPVTAATAKRVAEAYERWGRGVHPASLNFGDCFAYEVARSYGCSLLFVGKDFGQTDVDSVL